VKGIEDSMRKRVEHRASLQSVAIEPETARRPECNDEAEVVSKPLVN
jgi:hypothetical protein